jgi:CheY-like chemotaxis protein
MEQVSATIKPYANREECARANAATAALLARVDHVESRPAGKRPVAGPLAKRKRDKSNGLDRARGEEWILLVDDDPMLIDVGTQMLEHLGYRVMAASSGNEALEIFRTHAGLFDLVISDMNMPGMDGGQLTRELLAIRPDLPVLLCTGYSESMSASQARAIGAGAFRLKPIPLAEMARCVRGLIDTAH